MENKNRTNWKKRIDSIIRKGKKEITAKKTLLRFPHIPFLLVFAAAQVPGSDTSV